MSFNDQSQQLERSFARTTALLRQLLQGMQQRRTAWISARPSTLQPAPELERLAQRLAEEEQARTEILGRIATTMPLPPGVAAKDLHLNVTRIAGAMPTALGRSLRRAADEATSLAKTVRVEVALGERLLRFTQQAQETMLTEGAAATSERASAGGYDQHARLRAGLGRGAGAGKLIDGRV
jgi:hypothetical protein